MGQTSSSKDNLDQYENPLMAIKLDQRKNDIIEIKKKIDEINKNTNLIYTDHTAIRMYPDMVKKLKEKELELLTNELNRAKDSVDLIECNLINTNTDSSDEKKGCTNSAAPNYDPEATIDDNTCIKTPCDPSSGFMF